MSKFGRDRTKEKEKEDLRAPYPHPEINYPFYLIGNKSPYYLDCQSLGHRSVEPNPRMSADYFQSSDHPDIGN